jgi:hypothetical protein
MALMALMTRQFAQLHEIRARTMAKVANDA